MIICGSCTGVVIGFNQTEYEVSESEPLTSVYIELVTGILRKEVTVFATISDDTTLGTYFKLNMYYFMTLFVLY